MVNTPPLNMTFKVNYLINYIKIKIHVLDSDEQ